MGRSGGSCRGRYDHRRGCGDGGLRAEVARDEQCSDSDGSAYGCECESNEGGGRVSSADGVAVYGNAGHLAAGMAEAAQVFGVAFDRRGTDERRDFLRGEYVSSCSWILAEVCVCADAP